MSNQQNTQRVFSPYRICANRMLASILLISALWLLTSAHHIAAQTATGEITIRVLDPAGAVVPNADLSVVGTDTGALVRSLKTNDLGLADIPLLEPGRYNIRVSAQGFKQLDRNSVVVTVGNVVSLTIPLELGSSSESVTVTSETPLVETKSDTIAQVVEAKTLGELPIQNRSYLTSANFTAGVIPSTGSRDNTFAAYGNTGLQNAFLLDGARNVNYMRGLDSRTRDMVRPPIDAIQEFTVQTSNFSAEFGASAGGVVNAITKSGTNSFHGSAYDFLQNSYINATNYFSLTKPMLVQNQYGGSLGGPIKRNRAWFFGAYEGFHDRSTSTATAVVPTALERTGDFSKTVNSSGKVIPIYDPSTTAGSGSTATRTQFQGNAIPSADISAIGQALANEYPLSNVGTNEYVSNIPSRIDTKNILSRSDLQISSNDSVFGRYSRTTNATTEDGALPALAQPGGIYALDASAVGLGYTRVLSPTAINELRFAWTTIALNSDVTQKRDEIIPGSLDPQIDSGTPYFNVSNYAGLGAQPGCCTTTPLRKSSGVWDWSDNVSKSLGRHSLKTGGELMSFRPTTFTAASGRSTFGFSGVFTQNPQSRSATGNALADLLLGDANTLKTGTVGQSVERAWFIGGYVTDQWSVTSNLTLNIGGRYDYTSPSVDTQNRMGDFVLDPGSPLYGSLILSGDSHLPQSLATYSKKNFAPRVGFAYRVPHAGRELTVRSSYGIFYAQDEGTGVTNRPTANPPFWGYGAQMISSNQLDPATGFQLTPTANISRPTPPSAANFVLSPAATSTLVSWALHVPPSYVQEWSLSVQKQLPWNMMFETDYVGNHGVHLLGVGEGNQPTVLNSTTVNSRRPLIQYTDASVKKVRSWNESNYNGLSATLERRFEHGISFQNAFTYGHAFDLVDPALDLCDGCGVGDTIQNNYDIRANYGPSDNDVRLRYVLSGVFELPFGAGKPYLATDGILSQLAGGWAVSPVYQIQSGLPFTPGLSFDAANAGTVTRPNRVCNGNIGGGTLNEYFDTSCFVAPTSYTFGNSGRNVLRAPGMNNLDMSLQRRFPIAWLHESVLNFRAEAFNILNHPQWNAPGATVGNTLYGVISSARAPRQWQMAAHVTF